MAIVEIKNLNYFYPESEKKSLENINLSINEGEFVLVIGGSGSGKSSLVRAIAGLIPEFYGGKFGGEIAIDGQNIRKFDKKNLVQKIGMVFQDPESQLIMTNVEQEIAFGLENLNLDSPLMKRRIMEVSGALNLYPYLEKNIPELSGGLKQKVALASVLAMQPDILVLDEPTSQLDPVAGEEILTMIRRLNEENGTTVILIEQRLERCFHLADRFIVMDQGRIIHNGTGLSEIANWAVENNSPFIPPLAKLFALVDSSEIPLTVKEGRRILKSVIKSKNELLTDKQNEKKTEAASFKQKLNPVIEMEKVWFTYENGKEALKNIDLKINPGEFIVLMGENAAGKTTLLKNINGLLKPSRGHIRILEEDTKNKDVESLADKVGYLSQNPNDYLFMSTVQEELQFTLKNMEIDDNGRIEKILKELRISHYADRNPRDLSAGERQRVALAAVLVAEPQIILLDEPTRGLDYQLKQDLGQLLRNLQNEGKALLVTTHDVEFAAEYASEVILLSQGSVISRGSKYEMLTKSTFYSPQISKLFHKINDNIVTLDEGEKILKSLNA